jgi:hypothetical protein
VAISKKILRLDPGWVGKKTNSLLPGRNDPAGKGGHVPVVQIVQILRKRKKFFLAFHQEFSFLDTVGQP